MISTISTADQHPNETKQRKAAQPINPQLRWWYPPVQIMPSGLRRDLRNFPPIRNRSKWRGIRIDRFSFGPKQREPSMMRPSFLQQQTVRRLLRTSKHMQLNYIAIAAPAATIPKRDTASRPTALTFREEDARNDFLYDIASTRVDHHTHTELKMALCQTRRKAVAKFS